MKHDKVLLADNHQNMLAGVRTLLESRFEMIFMVADQASLLEAAKKINPAFVVADLSFSVSGEINIVRLLKKNFPELKLIILSVHDDRAAINECMDAGANGFVLKRNAVDDLIPAIDAVLNNSIYVSRSVLQMIDQSST